MEEFRRLAQSSTSEVARENGVAPATAVGDAPKVRKQRRLPVGTVAHEGEAVKPKPEETFSEDQTPVPLLDAEGPGDTHWALLPRVGLQLDSFATTNR